MTDLLHLSVCELAGRVQRGELLAEELTRQSLAAMARGAALNAFIARADDLALEQARNIDEKRARGEALGALAGVPIAVKDALCTRDMPTTAASRILVQASNRDQAGDASRGWRPAYDATVVARLREADAVIVGKANMDEFAMGSSNENSGFGPARNPWDPTRIPGGSSGGSAVSVAAGMTPASLGSDTGGSVRQPAALCGCVGVKPSYGRVSRYGLIAFASSLDQVGPLANDVRGAARLLGVIGGADPADSTCIDVRVDDYEAACDTLPRGLRIGVPEEYFGEGLDPDVRASVDRAISALGEQGCEIKPVKMPHTKYGVATYYVVATAEASSNLARFDGVRFGMRMEAHGDDLQTLYAATRGSGFGREVKRRIMLGTYVLSAGYYDAYYGKAQRVRALIRKDFDQVFSQVDVLATPSAPTPAFKLGEKLTDPLAMYLADVYTLPASLAGVCGLCVPCEATPPNDERPSLPVGLQLLAPSFQESRLFQVAAAYESVRPALGVPPLATGS